MYVRRDGTVKVEKLPLCVSNLMGNCLILLLGVRLKGLEVTEKQELLQFGRDAEEVF